MWEAEELKAQLLETESRLSEVEARAEKEATQRAEAERLLQAERKLTAQLQASFLPFDILQILLDRNPIHGSSSTTVQPSERSCKEISWTFLHKRGLSCGV